MRTIPPYVVALVVVALMTGNLLTADFLRYLFYVENLFGSANHIDFYPVAWSLAVEEWFYLLFAPLLFLVGRLLGRSDRRLDAAFAVLVIVAVAALRFIFAPHDWDLTSGASRFSGSTRSSGASCSISCSNASRAVARRRRAGSRRLVALAVLVATRNRGRTRRRDTRRRRQRRRRSRPFPLSRRLRHGLASAFSGRRTRRFRGRLVRAPSASGSAASPTRPISFTSWS